MGLFSSSKKTYVDSVVYNMAGDEDERPQYLQATTLNAILTGDAKTYLGQTINQSYLKGPGMNLRSFYRWAQENYSYIGLPSGTINGTGDINDAVIVQYLPHAAGQTVNLEAADIHRADYMDWAYQWMLDNHEALIDTNWAANIVGTTITISYEGGGSSSFTASNYDVNSKYLVAQYYVETVTSTSGTTVGTPSYVVSPDFWPSTVDWSKASDVETPHTYYKSVRTIVTNNSDSSVVSDNTVNQDPSVYYERHASFTRRVEEDHYPDGGVEMVPIRFDTMYWNQTGVEIDHWVSGGVHDNGDGTSTEVLTNVRTVTMTYEVRIDFYKQVHPYSNDRRVYIYRMNTGAIPALDALDDVTSSTQGQFFPIIPMRVNNQWLSDIDNTGYEIAKKAYKKVFNGEKYDECIDKLADNDKLSDIDFANIVFGVSLNVKEVKCKRYLYHFFKNLSANQTYGKAVYDAYGPAIQAYRSYKNALEVWRSFGSGMAGPAPTPVPYVSMRLNSITIQNNGSVNTEYNVSILWNYIEEMSGTGKYGSLKRGDAIVINQGTVEYDDPLYDDPTPVTTMDIIYQQSNTSWVGVRVVGAMHRNYVYNGKYTETYAGEALEDPDESGFIVPLHFATFKDMGLLDSSQMATACSFMVLNCYKIVKVKWYQKGIFKILLVVIFAIAAAFFTGGAGFGLLGANIAVGASLGFTGLTAGIIGSVVNALAAVALSTVLQPVIQKLGIIGQLLGVLVSFAIGAVMSSFSTGTAFDWGALLKPQNLLKLTNALADGYSSMVQQDALALQQSTQSVMSDYKDQMQSVDDMYSKIIGYANPNINPLNLVGNTKYMYPETRDTFLTRTLLTGSDIAELSQTLLNDFSDLTLKLPGYV